AVFSAWRTVWSSISDAQEMSLLLMLVGMSPPPSCSLVDSQSGVWPAGLEPASQAWRAHILSRWTTTTGCSSDGRPDRTLTCVTRFAAARLDARPPGGGCQGGDRTPAFRVTAGRLSARLPGIGVPRRGIEPRPPGLPAEGRRAVVGVGRLASLPLDYRGVKGASPAVSTERAVSGAFG